jgi:hypothetical protein
MNYDIEKYAKVYTAVKAFMESVPRQLWPILLPATPGGLPDLEVNIANFQSRASEREQVISVQRLCDLPLRPNEPLSETTAKARLQGRKYRALLDQLLDRSEDGSDPDGD